MSLKGLRIQLKLTAKLSGVIYMVLASKTWMMQEWQGFGIVLHGLREPQRPGIVCKGDPCMQTLREQEAREVIGQSCWKMEPGCHVPPPKKTDILGKLTSKRAAPFCKTSSQLSLITAYTPSERDGESWETLTWVSSCVYSTLPQKGARVNKLGKARGAGYHLCSCKETLIPAGSSFSSQSLAGGAHRPL